MTRATEAGATCRRRADGHRHQARRALRLPQPLIAQVNGAALGGGFEVVLACDIVVAADHATFGLPELRRENYAGEGGVHRLSRQLPSNSPSDACSPAGR